MNAVTRYIRSCKLPAGYPRTNAEKRDTRTVPAFTYILLSNKIRLTQEHVVVCALQFIIALYCVNIALNRIDALDHV